MNERDEALLKRRQQKLHAIIKENERLPKASRDASAVADAKKKMTTIDRWLKEDSAVEDKPQPPAAPQPVTPTRQPEGVIKVDTIEQLQEMFHDIKKKNIAIAGPPDVLDALRMLMKRYVSKEFAKNFRSDNGANVHFWGVDPHGDPWNCLLKIDTRKPGKTLAYLLDFTGYGSFKNWKSHGFKNNANR